MPGFWDMCQADAYLFKLTCIFLPLMLLLNIYLLAAGQEQDSYVLPAGFAAALLGAIFYRWQLLKTTFAEHIALTCRISGISPAGGLFGLQIYVSFYETSDSGKTERGCFLIRFSRRVKKLQQGSAITVFCNERKNMYLIKEAFMD